MVVAVIPAPVATDDDDDDSDDGDDNNNLCKTYGCLRNKKYTQSKCISSSIAAVTNASTMLYDPLLLSSSERR